MDNNYNNFNNQPTNGMNYGQPINNQPIGGMSNQDINQQTINNNAPNQNINYGQPMNNGMMNQQSGNNLFSKIPKDKTSIIGYIGSVLTAISTFLPFTVVSAWGFSQSVNYFSNNGELADGVFVFALMIITLILIMCKKNVFAIGSTALAAILFINNFIKINEIKEEYGSLAEVKSGAAVYMIIVGLIILVVHFIMYIKENPNCFKNLFNKNPQAQVYGNTNYSQPMNGVPNQYMNPQPMNNNIPNQNINYGQPQNNQYPNNNNNGF